MKTQTEMLSLIRQVHLRFARFFSRKLAREQITLPQYMLLMSILEEGPQKMNSLAKFLQASTPSMTNLVDKLEAIGYARRLPHPEDRRANIIELTERGKNFVNNFRRDSLNVLSDAIGKMPTADQGILKRFYKELIRRLDASLLTDGGG